MTVNCCVGAGNLGSLEQPVIINTEPSLQPAKQVMLTEQLETIQN